MILFQSQVYQKQDEVKSVDARFPPAVGWHVFVLERVHVTIPPASDGGEALYL